VIWFGIQNSEPLKKLGLDVVKSVEAIGWEADRQNFVPHLTIGRIKQVPDKHLFQRMIDEHKKTRMQEIRVSEFHLYESTLSRTGPIYNVLETYSLKEA
jgi:2'-5' RNA ligase